MKKRKLALIFIIISCFTLIFSFNNYASDENSLLRQKTYSSDATKQIMNDIFIPIRKTMEHFGAIVNDENDYKTIEILIGERVIYLKIKDNRVIERYSQGDFKGILNTLKENIILIDGVSYANLEFFEKILGLSVNKSQDESITIEGIYIYTCKENRSYYINHSLKNTSKDFFDKLGIRITDYGDTRNFQYNPLFIANDAIDYYTNFVYFPETYKPYPEYSFRMINIAEWLMENSFIKEEGVFLPYNFEFNGADVPWFSGITQARAAKALINAYLLTKDERFLISSKEMIKPILLSIDDGGFSYFEEELRWFEEYTKPYPNHVLNGHMSIIEDLYYCNTIIQDTNINLAILEGIKSLEIALPYYRSYENLGYALSKNSEKLLEHNNLNLNYQYDSYDLIHMKYLNDLSFKFEHNHLNEFLKEYISIMSLKNELAPLLNVLGTNESIILSDSGFRTDEGHSLKNVFSNYKRNANIYSMNTLDTNEAYFEVDLCCEKIIDNVSIGFHWGDYPKNFKLEGFLNGRWIILLEEIEWVTDNTRAEYYSFFAPTKVSKIRFSGSNFTKRDRLILDYFLLNEKADSINLTNKLNVISERHRSSFVFGQKVSPLFFLDINNINNANIGAVVNEIVKSAFNTEHSENMAFEEIRKNYLNNESNIYEKVIEHGTEKVLENNMIKNFKKGLEKENYNYTVDETFESAIINHPWYDFDTQHLAWSTSYIFQGFSDLYSITKNEDLLVRWIELTKEVLMRRDDNENRISWDGNIYPVWSSTSRYHTAYFDIIDDMNKTIARIFFHGTGQDKTLVYVHPEEDNLFSLEINMKSLGKVYKFEKVSIKELKDRIHNEIQLESYNSPGLNNSIVEMSILSNQYTCVKPGGGLVSNISIPSTVHTGLLLNPMVDLYIYLNELNHIESEYFDKNINESIEAIVSLTWDDEGYFKEPNNTLTILGGGTILPWNQQSDFIAAIAKYGSYKKDEELLKIVRKWSEYFMTHTEKIEINNNANGLIWKYWEDPTGTITWNETTNYGGLVVNAISQIYDLGIAFSKENIDEIVNTVNNMVIGENKISSRLDGVGSGGNPLSLIKYLPLCKYGLDISKIDFGEIDKLNWYHIARIIRYYYYLE